MMHCTICPVETSRREGFRRQTRLGQRPGLMGEVPSSDPGCAGPSGVWDPALAHQASQVSGRVAAFLGCLCQRQNRVVSLAQGSFELRCAGLQRYGRCLAPVAAQGLGPRAPVRGQDLDRCSVNHVRISGSRRTIHGRPDLSVHSHSPSASLRSASVSSGSPSPRRTERSRRSTRRPRSASPAARATA